MIENIFSNGRRNFSEVRQELPRNFSRHRHDIAGRVETFVPRSAFLTRRVSFRFVSFRFARRRVGSVSVLSRRSNLCPFRQTVNGYTVDEKKNRERERERGRRENRVKKGQETKRHRFPYPSRELTEIDVCIPVSYAQQTTETYAGSVNIPGRKPGGGIFSPLARVRHSEKYFSGS